MSITDSKNSYRQILRSSAVIGGASALNIIIGLIRTKAVAILLGPAGIGMIGLLQNLMTTASTVSALGLETVGTRQVAEAVGREDIRAISIARRSLFWGSFVLAVTGASVFWLLRNVLAEFVLHDAEFANALGWLALGVALTVASGTQGALLNGLRRIGDIAWLRVLSALLSVLLGVGALMLWGDGGIVAFVISAPFASSLLGWYYTSRLPTRHSPPTRFNQLIVQWKTMARLGTAFMVTGLIGTIGQLIVRVIVQQNLGSDAQGQFQAAWTISLTYIGFVLTAMGTDFYPRLTAIISDHAAANRLVNQQTEVALLLAGPVFLAMLGLAPWVIELLYSSRFTEAVSILYWQVLGDILKIASWPLGFIILASGDGRTYLLVEIVATATLISLTWIGIPIWGLEVTGIAFLCMFAVILPLQYWLARRRTGFKWSAQILRHLSILLIVATTLIGIANISTFGGASLGVLSALVFGGYSAVQLEKRTDPKGTLAIINTLYHRLFTKRQGGND